MIETEEDFYSTIKLVTGEEVFAIVSTDPETPETLILQDPVVIQVIHGARGSFVRVEPWLHIPNDDFYFINFNKVVTMTEIDEDHDMIEYYLNYLAEKLEQLRALEAGMRIAVAEIDSAPGGVDTIEDLQAVRQRLGAVHPS